VARLSFPVLELNESTAQDVRFGRKLVGFSLGQSGPVALLAPDGTFLALYEQHSTDARAIAVFV